MRARSHVPFGTPPSPREMEVLRLAAAGRSVRETAKAMGTKVPTTKAQRTNLLHRLGAHNMTEAVSIALVAGHLRLEDLQEVEL